VICLSSNVAVILGNLVYRSPLETVCICLCYRTVVSIHCPPVPTGIAVSGQRVSRDVFTVTSYVLFIICINSMEQISSWGANSMFS
jgi:hypothetical protein